MTTTLTLSDMLSRLPQPFLQATMTFGSIILIVCGTVCVYLMVTKGASQSYLGILLEAVTQAAQLFFGIMVVFCILLLFFLGLVYRVNL